MRPAELDLTDEVPPEGTVARAVVEYLAEELDARVTSALSWERPRFLAEASGSDDGPARVTRLEVDLGDLGRRALAVTEGPRGHDAIVLPTGAYRMTLRVRECTVRGAPLAVTLAEDPTPPAHASNVVVEELTRLAHSFDPDAVRTVRLGLPPALPGWSDLSTGRLGELSTEEWRSVLSGVPVLSAFSRASLVGDGTIADDYLLALRDVAAGAPLEWALRRPIGVGP